MKKVKINLTFRPWIAEQLRIEAARRNCTMSEIVEEALATRMRMIAKGDK